MCILCLVVFVSLYGQTANQFLTGDNKVTTDHHWPLRYLQTGFLPPGDLSNRLAILNVYHSYFQQSVFDKFSANIGQLLFFPIFTLVWLKHYRLLGKNNKKIRNFKMCFFSFVCGLPMSTLSLTLILHVFPKEQKINKNNFQTKPNVHKEDHPNMSPNCSLIMP